MSRKHNAKNTKEPYGYYPAGIPRSFFVNDTNKESNQGINSNVAPIWPSIPQGVMPLAPNTSFNNDPIFVQTDNQTDLPQQYSPSDVYADSSFGDEREGSESSEAAQLAQKRLSAFQRLGPVSQPKKPKLTINLMLNKEQAVREVVDATDSDADTPVHLRQDIADSTDETVKKYLPFWPWKRRIALSKKVTNRHSKSVMILEQEQMEEIYDRDNLFIQVTVTNYPKNWTKEQVLDTLLDLVKGKSFIPCFIEFSQKECKFLVLRSRASLVALHKTGFIIHKDGAELKLVISQTDLSLNQIDFIPRLVLRKMITMLYDGERKLNLREFTLKYDISHFLYYPLNRSYNQTELIQLQNAVAWDYLTDLDLSHNRLTSISALELSATAPRLKNLNLSHNYLEKATALLRCRDLSLHSIWLEGNPLCSDYIDPAHYIKVVKMIFPSLTEIDGVQITLKGDMPPIKRNYCPEDAVEVVEKFLEVYFPLLDAAPEDRALIQNLYADNAVMTITYRNKLHHGPVYRCFRNLFLRTRDFDKGEMDSIEGATSIGKLINRWPEFIHDPFTFTVDVLLHTDFSTIIRINGLFKLKAESLAEDEHLLAFTRTIVLRTKDCNEYKIHNELIYWDEPTTEYAANAFQVTTVKTKQISFKLEPTTSESVKEKLIEVFMKLTELQRKPSERCLELKNWNFKVALEHFTKLLKLDSLESLTKEEDT